MRHERTREQRAISQRNIERWKERAGRMRAAAAKLPDGRKKKELLRSADQLEALMTRLADSASEDAQARVQTTRRIP